MRRHKRRIWFHLWLRFGYRLHSELNIGHAECMTAGIFHSDRPNGLLQTAYAADELRSVDVVVEHLAGVVIHDP